MPQLVVRASKPPGAYGVMASWGLNADYSTAHDVATGDDYGYVGDRGNFGQQWTSAVYQIYRWTLKFDTSELPDDAVVKRLILSLSRYDYPEGDPYYPSVASNVIIVPGTDLVGNNPADYGQILTNSSTVLGGHSALGMASVDKYYSIELGGAAYSDVSKTGYTIFGMISSLDILETVPTEITSNSDMHQLLQLHGYSGDYSPKLTIEFTSAITRVTNLIHRYNRNTGVYALEMALGGITTDFGLPEWLTASRPAVPEVMEEATFQQRMEAIAKQLQEEAGMSREEALRIARKLVTLEETARREKVAAAGLVPTPPPTPPAIREPGAPTIEALPPGYVAPTKLYTCPYCNAKFATWSLMQEHIAESHGWGTR